MWSNTPNFMATPDSRSPSPCRYIPGQLRLAVARLKTRMPGTTSPAITIQRDEKTIAGLPPLDLLHLVGPGAAGGDHLDRIALLLVDESARERRGDRDPALLGVGLRLADELPDLLLVGVLVDQRDGG